MAARGSKRLGYHDGKRWVGWHATSDEQKQVLRALERTERQAARREIQDQTD